MKKLLLLTLLLPALNTADAQTKKVVLHDYTGVKCQFCTDGTVKIENLLASNANTFIPIQIHSGTYTPAGSPMSVPEGEAIDAALTIPGYPAGSVDMTRYPPASVPAQYVAWTGVPMSRGFWSDAFNIQKAKPAIVSVSINNRKRIGTDSFEADIVVAFSAAAAGNKDINLNVFILEDSIKAENGQEQTNFSGGPYSGASPLTWATHKYVHNNVLRKSLSGVWGFTGVIPKAPVVGTKYTKKVAFKAPSTWNIKNIRIVAYAAYHGAGELDKEILNGEMMHIPTSFFKVGVDDVVSNVQILSAYPNPVKLGGVVNIQFNIAQDELVTMNVYNTAGQKVATPYISNDIQGGHFIQWKTGLDNIVPGTYIIEIATPSGKQTQKVVLQ